MVVVRIFTNGSTYKIACSITIKPLLCLPVVSGRVAPSATQYLDPILYIAPQGLASAKMTVGVSECMHSASRPGKQ